MNAWVRTISAGCLTALLVGCGAPGGSSPQVPSAPHEVTAEYTPGEVSVAPSIEHARPNVMAETLAQTSMAGGTEGLAIGADGTVYVAEPYAYRIRRITPGGQVSTLAGGSDQPGRSDGQGSQAEFMGPKDIAIAPDGTLYAADFDAVRRITPEGRVTTLPLKNPDGSDYQPIELFGIAADSQGNLYLSATYWIDRVSPQGVVTRFAGNDAKGFADGPSGRAYFNLPRKLAFDPAGNLYVADFGNLRIRRISPDGSVRTLAGNGILGFTDGDAAHSRLNFPSGIAVDAAGNVLVADTYNHAIRQITPDGHVKTVAGNNAAGFADGSGVVQFNHPLDVAVRADGAILVADSGNARVRILR